MVEINSGTDNQLTANGQRVDGLAQANPSPAAEIVRRGVEALARQSRSWDDSMMIAEALQIGRTEVMQAVGTNQPTGKRYEKAMHEWLIVHGFQVIDKGDRNRLLECLKHRNEIEKWRATLTEAERFRWNHPNTVLRKFKGATAVPNLNAAPKVSAFTKLKNTNIELQEELHRAKRAIASGGGDLWSVHDTPRDIAWVMVESLPFNKVEKVIHQMKKLLTEKKEAWAEQVVATQQAALANCSTKGSANGEA